MDMVLNELSFEGQFAGYYEGAPRVEVLMNTVLVFRTHPKARFVYVCRALNQATICPSLSLYDCLLQMPPSDQRSAFLRIVTSNPYIDDLLDAEAPQHVCMMSDTDVSGSSIAGAAHVGASLCSLPDAGKYSLPQIHAVYSPHGSNSSERCVDNYLSPQDLRDRVWLRYELIAKHAKGGSGTLMDLDDVTAKKVLNSGIRDDSGRQVYSYHEGKIYEFQWDGIDKFHGYPIRASEAPANILRRMVDDGIITDVLYRRLIH
jgi:hypothetical protein